MPIEITVDPKQELVIAKCTGTLCESDFKMVFRNITNSPDYRSSHNEIWDIRDTGEIQLSFDNWNGLNDAKADSKNREAIIVSTLSQYKIADQYALLAKDTSLDVRVFYDYDEAIEWAAVRKK